MGSTPSEELIKELESEAYLAILRAVEVNPHVDSLAREGFLAQARSILNISNETAQHIVEIVKTDRELIRRGQRPPLAGAVQNTPISALPPGPIGAPGSSRPRGRPPVSGGVTRTPVARQPSLNRSRNTRSNGAVDPNNYVGRRIWRWYPDEDPERPWVEGFLTDYDPTTNTYSILYDPNDPEKQEMVETGFDFSTTNPTEYVLGDIFDLKEQFGSSRLATRPEQVVIPPPTAITGPSKRRRSAPLKVPAGAPFPPTWFETAVLDAGQEDLQSMLTKL